MNTNLKCGDAQPRRDAPPSSKDGIAQLLVVQLHLELLQRSATFSWVHLVRAHDRLLLVHRRLHLAQAAAHAHMQKHAVEYDAVSGDNCAHTCSTTRSQERQKLTSST